MTLRIPAIALLAFTSACTAPADDIAPSSDIEPGAGTAEWTVMVYMVGDNNLEPYALADINEMEEVGSTSEVQVAVQLDRSAEDYGSDNEWDGARRFHIEQDEDTSVISSPALEDLGRTNSGQPEAVAEFVDWAVDAWPAEKYALLIWNHGSGWRADPMSVGLDDSTGSSLDLTDGDLREALDGAVGVTGQRLDLLVFEACLMQAYETAHDVAPYADYLIASQDLTYETAWRYDRILGHLSEDPSQDGEAAAKLLVQDYRIPGDTISAVDLGAIGELDSALDVLADAMLALPDPTGPLAEAEAAAWTAPDAGIDRDLGQVLEVLAANEDPKVATAALGALEALDEALLAVDNSSDFEALSGMSIFTGFQWVAPYLADPNFAGYIDMLEAYRRGSWAVDGQWDDLVAPIAAGEL